MMEISIRAVARADLAPIAELERAAFPDPWNETGLALLLTPPYGGLCAWQGEQLAGYIGWSHFPAAGTLPAEAEITRIAVSPAMRRQGVGRRLLSAMLTRLSPTGEPLTVRLDVRESNTAARGLYRALGFTACGRRPRFYGDEDALEMLLELPRGWDDSPSQERITSC